MNKELTPILYTRDEQDIHAGGFSKREENELGLQSGLITKTFEKLHELITLHRENFSEHIKVYSEKVLEKSSEYTLIAPNVYAHESAVVDRMTSFETKNGTIVIEKNATVFPFSYLVGPVRIDEGATVNPHSNISGTYVGKFSKVGGEVANSVIEAYSNKGHYGYIGDSYIGSWVNIGGGTSTSNLKNTYGTIKLSGVETGEQFLGSIICDYVKTAVNTSIYTGKVIGVSSHIYGTVTSDVPSFVNYISKEKMIELPLNVALETARRMGKRRGIELTKEEEGVLTYAYTETKQERENGGVTEGKLSF